MAPFILCAFEPRYTHSYLYGAVIAAYALAKARATCERPPQQQRLSAPQQQVAEHYDAPIYAMTRRVVSGHTLKHLLAAAATAIFYVQAPRLLLCCCCCYCCATAAAAAVVLLLLLCSP